ncbi:MAG: putative baseplate assembly protein [Pseudomonadota bacterium]
MPLPKPTLDNRTFDQLVAEGRGLIPRLAPQWTDHNASDPGITVLELAAWLTEQNIFRFDRLPDEAVRRFARLVGAEPMPPQVARTVVGVGNGNAAGLALPPRLRLHDAGGALFETLDAVYASPARLAVLGTARGKPTGALADATAANDTLSAYAPLGERPRGANAPAFHLGFDQALGAPGAMLSLHAWTPDWTRDEATRQALIDEQAAATCKPGDWRLHHLARTVWEYHAGGGEWFALPSVEDDTRALSLSGMVRFGAPSGHQPGGVPGWPALFFIRCRLVRGRYECPPRLLHVAFNAVRAEHALGHAEQALGPAAGHAGARFAFPQSPIVADSVQLRLDDGLGHVQADWTTRLDWDASGAHDRHVLLLPEDGGLASGNGLRGGVLPAGFTVFARWRRGGGTAGNLQAGTLQELPASAENLALAPALAGLAQPLTVAQPFGATGGAARESLDALRARAYTLANAVDKAVTLQDIERLALATPGMPVARTHAVAGLWPELPCYPAPGVVAVVVVPRCRLPAPMPSRALLEAVRAYLEPRRLVTGEIRVLAPHYRAVGVQATLQLEAETDAAAVLRLADGAIRRFFDPLSGGPDGTGWPIGRAVYRSELLALLAALPGVLRVTGFGLLTAGGTAGGCGCGGGCTGGCGGNAAAAQSADGAARCDNVTLCAHELVRPGRHRLRVAADWPLDLQRSSPHECEPVQ